MPKAKDAAIKLIAMLHSVESIEDRCWLCRNEWDAKAMHAWLRDNHIAHKMISETEFERLSQE